MKLLRMDNISIIYILFNGHFGVVQVLIKTKSLQFSHIKNYQNIQSKLLKIFNMQLHFYIIFEKFIKHITILVIRN